jgi:hypothetical protein
MQAQVEVEPSPTSSTFAGVLAALTRSKIQSSSNWEDDLEPDVATLSYDRALSAHARYRPGHFPIDSAAESREDSATCTDDAVLKPESAPAFPIDAASRAPAEQFVTRRAALEEKRMRASVTLRMSKAEFAQLQQRAVEAGLTVSAYLRSCTFEVETLRAQVKQALAELRTAQRESSPESSQPPRTSWLARVMELMRIPRPNHRPAVA